jgi:hypothetical protein
MTWASVCSIKEFGFSFVLQCSFKTFLDSVSNIFVLQFFCHLFSLDF